MHIHKTETRDSPISPRKGIEPDTAIGRKLRLSVIGCGYLGAVHAAAMASIGHEVTGIDVDPHKVASLSRGEATFFEPGLQDILAEGLSSGRLRFTTEFSAARDAEVHFIGVGTPQTDNQDAADLTYVNSALSSLIPYLNLGDIVAGKSTVPVGTAESLASRVSNSGATLIWNPEFLREGWAVKDTLYPDRIVVGAPSGAEGERAVNRLRSVYHTAVASGIAFIVTDYATAELVKVAANAFLATKISFINAMAEIAEVTGADVSSLADAIGLDDRIGRKFLGAGVGFGGGCLPKDIRAFVARAEELGCGPSVGFLREVDSINLRRRRRAAELVEEALNHSVKGKKIAVLGAAFKPFSDDVRDSPALEIANRLHNLGARVVVTDPKALHSAERLFPQLSYTQSTDEALLNAQAVVLVTEWDEYRRDLSPDHAASLVSKPIIIDGRNCLDQSIWVDAGWSYYGMGRPAAFPRDRANNDRG